MSTDQAREHATSHFKQKKEDLNARVVDALRIEQIAFQAKLDNMGRLRTERLARDARVTAKQRAAS